MAEIITVRAEQVRIGDEFYNKYAKTGWEAVEFVDQCYTTKRVTIHLRTSKKTYEADTMLSVRRDEKKRATLSDPAMNYACWTVRISEQSANNSGDSYTIGPNITVESYL